MSEAKHTPGPWIFVPENAGLMQDHGYGILHGEAEPGSGGWEKNLFVCVGASTNAARALGEGVPEANARLIASAPDLLEALKTTAGNIRSLRDAGLPGPLEEWARVVDAAISKATEGQS